MEPRPGVLTVRQTARVLQFSERRIYEFLEKGEIPGAMKIGGSWRISAQLLHQWINGRWPQKESAEVMAPAQIASKS